MRYRWGDAATEEGEKAVGGGDGRSGGCGGQGGVEAWPCRCWLIVAEEAVAREDHGNADKGVEKGSRLAEVENGMAQAACFPFCAMNPNIGVVAIPDARQHVLSKFGKSQQMTPTSIELVDIADLVKGVSNGEVLIPEGLLFRRTVNLFL
ncbi:hypothetical protein GUJ93_ZPchr0010g10911 [Zizania palustris]|uniref:Uncharacterized protein n=1 Tax=Zizania palustris TaxID=103762 RepID=A0A8J6BRP3_ZIZPA|nr:hypothetical protein GUJ93_ZPchr0010g10911 [Zizania palustris]